jgi:hypothetical protein
MIFRCPECRTRRRDYGLFTQHLKTTGHALCHCGGYHYAHRPGSPYCEGNPMSDVLLASRYGTPDSELADIAAWCAFTKPGKVSGAACPF